MSKSHKLTVLRILGSLLILYATFSLGNKVGMEVGKADYHNQYFRPLQMQLYELRSAMDSGWLGLDQSKQRITDLCDLSSQAGNEKEFYRLLNIQINNAAEHALAPYGVPGSATNK